MINDLSQDESNQILIWLNYEKLKTIVENEYPVEWEKSGKDLWKFIHVNEELTHKDSNNRDIPNSIKENVLEIQKKYLISVLNPKTSLEIQKSQYQIIYQIHKQMNYLITLILL
ncbi:hypothetical protein NW733_04685 [Mycoplasmopsis felis]|nr:hypothetical protein [Mycoplasmopsis felis]MCU9931938.1 hypothetical protein [Mycoplasmopsis felis]